MFRRDDGQERPDRLETIIGKDAEVKGTITSATGLRIDGKMEGQIVNSGDVIIGESAVVVADINGRNVIIAGQVQGNLSASGRLEIAPTGRVVGDIVTGILVITEGGHFEGKSEMQKREPKA
jgi:cytoskeletal protein CcmA (bactofilin family)